MILYIDGIGHQIDSTDPELLGKWIVEMFGRIQQISPATTIELQTRPSFVYSEREQAWRPDWLADSRILCQMQPVRTPRDFIDALNKQLDQWETLNGKHH